MDFFNFLFANAFPGDSCLVNLILENVYPFIRMKCDVEIDYAAVAMLGTGIATYEQYRKGRMS
jgi:hypothetical protein